jgi:hypothetical protein
VSTTTAAIAYLLADRLAGDALYAACAAVNAAGAAGPLRLPESGAGVQTLLRPQPERLPIGALQLTVSAQAPISRIATANRALTVEVEVAAAIEVPIGDGYEIDATALGDLALDAGGELTLAGYAWVDALRYAMTTTATLGALGVHEWREAQHTIEIHQWADSGADVDPLSVVAEVRVLYTWRQQYGGQ